MKRMIRHGNGGFTLVELLIVISVLAVLAAILIPTFSNVGRNQRQSACFNNLRELGVALAQYRQDYGAYPAAPRPEYLNSRGMEYEAMPYEASHVIEPAACVEPWPADGLDDLIAGGAFARATAVTYTVWIADTGTPDSFDWTDGTASGSAVNITGKAQPLSNDVYITFGETTGHEGGERWTFTARPVTLPEGWEEWTLQPDGRYANVEGRLNTRNFGLATLYNLYLHDRRDYVRRRQLLHCPAMKDTEGVELGANVAAVRATLPQADHAARSFDPLWAGFNTYDVTYNYDQYHNDILDFDTAAGFAKLNVNRQLRNANPPADTVVTWCFAHQREQVPSYTVPTEPDLTIELSASLTEEERAQALRAIRQQVDSAERGRKSQVSLVLWVDGTVSVERPRLMRGATAENLHHFFWVPPFLYSTGDWRE